MSMWRTPNGARASITALCTAGVDPIVPDSTDALGPERVDVGGRLHRHELNDGSSAAEITE